MLCASAVHADSHVSVPAGGGLGALDVRIDLKTYSVTANGVRIAIDPRAVTPSAEATAVAVPIGQGRSIVHVRVAPPEGDAASVAWEALLAADRSTPLFAGLTGYVDGDPGERHGSAVQVVAHGETSFVLVGRVEEDLRICGQARTLLEPQAVYPSTLDLRPATVQRLSADERSAAEPILATPTPPGSTPPLASLLVAVGSSVPGSRGAELTDGDPRTVWTERRPGMGQGEFAVLHAPPAVPITRFRIVAAPPAPAPTGAAPRRLYLVTPARAFEVTLPADGWQKPGAAFDIPLPTPIDASCVALVLDDAYSRGLAHPDVGLAEVAALSEFDDQHATLDDLAGALSSARGAAAAAVLARSGSRALEAVRKAFDALDAKGRARALDVAASQDRCEDAAPILMSAWCESGASAIARERLTRCPGAAPIVAAALRADPKSRSCVAPALAAMAPVLALEPIADALGELGASAPEPRAELRGAFFEALRGASREATEATKARATLSAIAADARRGPEARLEILRAARGRLADVRKEADATLAELLGGTPAMRVRYLALEPLRELAAVGDPDAGARLAGAIGHDPDWPVRSRAAELGAGLDVAKAALLAAARDPEPRVREAALASLGGEATPSLEAVALARAALAGDPWPFVRVRAVALLGAAPSGPETDAALAGGLNDDSPRVREASIGQLATRRTVAWRAAIRARLDAKDEAPEVRAAAARALGALCEDDAADRLTELARFLATPGLDEDAQRIALGALEGLEVLHPSDLRDRLAPLLAAEPGSSGPPRATPPPFVQEAARRALAASGGCVRRDR
jgi:hypothetical protein